LPELLEHLKAALKDRYDVERELGQGGMATVFLARDIKHGREVAIKVLHEDLAMALGADRFRREIQIATSLSHPHILALYDSGEADGSLYYVMPFVTGESLRARIDREKILPIEDALQITQEVASALDFAHRKNIVHRDIKPENILLEEGHAIVADFGIARALNSMSNAASLTQTGMSLGTPTYMSPEQAFAEKDIDGRSDEYSLACVLYEMLTGQPPFTGPNAQSIMARHSMAAVPSMQIVRNTIPDEVEDLVQKALSKSPADRFPTLGEFAAELKECVIDHATTTRRIDRRTVARPVQKAPSKKKYAFAALGLIPVVIAALVAWRMFGHSTTSSAGGGKYAATHIAVLYFDDVSSAHKLGYLADGLTESLIDRLSQVSALDVVSKSGVSMYRHSDASPDSIAKIFSAGILVKGSVDQAGDKLNVSVRLIDGNSGTDIDRKNFQLPVANILTMQDSLATQLADFLRPSVGQEVRLREQRFGTSNAAAYTLLQRAERSRKDGEDQAAANDTAASVKSFSQADSLLIQAEKLDEAWVDPITAQARVAFSKAVSTRDPLAARPAIEAGVEAATRAIAKAPRDADALEVRGRLQYRKWELALTENPRDADQLLDLAEKDLKAAVDIKPSLADSWNTLSAIYNQKDQFVDAKLAAQKAYEQDAYLSGTDKVLWRLYATSYDLEQFTDAVKWCEEGGRRFPASETFVRCRLWLLTTPGAKNISQAWSDYLTLQKLTSPQVWKFRQHEAKMLVAAGIARTGQLDSARHVLVSARGNSQDDPQGELYAREAFIRTLFHTPADTDEAFNLLKTYVSINPIHRKGFAESQSWWWKSLKDDPRFRQLVSG
jgi:eukaryotic-like serine/threonine-protein kinase